MTTAALLPPVPALPHDPLRMVLSSAVGWRLSGTAKGLEITLGLCGEGDALALAPLPEATRDLADGTFGGWTLPANAALTAAGDLLLLDRATGMLLRFDACSCAFIPLPCIGGIGAAPREVDHPGGISVSRKHLYVCDAGNHRVQVFGERDLLLRAIWGTPPESAQPWQPVDVAVSQRGVVAVADPANGAIHFFEPSGRWLRKLSGLGGVQRIEFDCDGLLFVAVQSEPAVKVLDALTGEVKHAFVGAGEAAGRFSPLPFPVGSNGELSLGACCVEPSGSGVFSASGAPLSAQDGPEPLSFPLRGSAFTLALDSELYRCQWDRLALYGELPEHTAVRISAYTSETELPQDIVENLPDDVWSPCPPFVSEAAPHGSDCMLRLSAGRYLWLKLELSGNGHSTPRIASLDLVFPRVSLRRYLPGVFGADPVSAEFTDRLLAVFDHEFRAIERTVDTQASLFDPLSAPSDDPDPQRDFLSWLATWIGVTLDRGWPEERRRRYLKQVGRLLPLRGTLQGLKEHLRLYLGLDERCCQPLPPCRPCDPPGACAWKLPELVLEHFRLRNWLFLGGGRLGAQSRVWGEHVVNRTRLVQGGEIGSAQLGVTQLRMDQDPFRDPFHLYAHKFTVFAPAAIARSSGAKRGLDRLIRAEKPAHTTFQIVWVEPRFRIGIQSMVGFDSAIGRYPSGSRLSEMTLGRGTLLAPTQMTEQNISIGKQATIGTTTRLD